VITGCTITENFSDFLGGGIGCYKSAPIISDCSITGNTATRGAGIDCDQSDPSLTNSTISNNSGDYGAGIACFVSAPVIDSCIISGNAASTRGGGIHCFNSSPEITGSSIYENAAGNIGGGIDLYRYSSPIISDCQIYDNEATEDGSFGGGVYSFESSPVITGCSIHLNSALNYGGGMVFQRFSDAIIANSYILDNSTSNSGGGIAILTESATIISNCVFSGNSTWSSGHGGGVLSAFSSPSLLHCVFYDNFSGEGTAFACMGGSDMIVQNCISRAGGEEAIHDDGTGLLEITYSDIEGGWTGEGNIDADPLFADPESRDFHISYDSPCINVGTDAGVYVDIDGETRPQGVGYDIGIDEVFLEGPVMKVTPESFTTSTYCEATLDNDILSIISFGTDPLEYEVLPGIESWLTIDGDLSGTLFTGDSAFINVVYDISGLLPGAYSDSLTVISNDPNKTEVIIPITMEIITPVTVSIHCDDPNVRRGELLNVDIALENITEVIQSFELWIDVYLINGDPYDGNPIFPTPITIGPGGVMETTMSLRIPGTAPIGGPYGLYVRLGLLPGVWDEDYLEFFIIL